jgi:hypothetical protein
LMPLASRELDRRSRGPLHGHASGVGGFGGPRPEARLGNLQRVFQRLAADRLKSFRLTTELWGPSLARRGELSACGPEIHACLVCGARPHPKLLHRRHHGSHQRIRRYRLPIRTACACCRTSPGKGEPPRLALRPRFTNRREHQGLTTCSPPLTDRAGRSRHTCGPVEHCTELVQQSPWEHR